MLKLLVDLSPGRNALALDSSNNMALLHKPVLPSASESNITEQGEKSEACNQSITLNQALSLSDASVSRDVIDHIARLDFKIDAQGGTLVSFQQEYQDYLDEIGCVDPHTVKESQTNPMKKDGVARKDAPAPDIAEAQAGLDLEIDEIDEGNGDAGRFKFENVLKSMVARLELYNTLAPI